MVVVELYAVVPGTVVATEEVVWTVVGIVVLTDSGCANICIEGNWAVLLLDSLAAKVKLALTLYAVAYATSAVSVAIMNNACLNDIQSRGFMTQHCRNAESRSYLDLKVYYSSYCSFKRPD